MSITLDAQLEAALQAAAERQGVAPETLAISALRQRFAPTQLPEPLDEWERRLRSIATDCGVSPPDESFTSEALYE